MESKVVGLKHDRTVCTAKKCGCLKTSEKLRKILKSFPTPPPPTPTTSADACLYRYTAPSWPALENEETNKKYCDFKDSTHTTKAEAQTQVDSRTWQVLFDLAQLVQMSVAAAALALYYLIYCYMQLVYYMFRSALYFHQADGPMKVTIAVVALTSLVVGFNIVIRMKKIIVFF